MSEIVLTLPNDAAGAVARRTLARDQKRLGYEYRADMSDWIRAPRIANLIWELPVTFHLIEIGAERAGAIVNDLLGYHRDPSAVDGDRGFVLAAEPNWLFSLCAPPGGPPVIEPDNTTYLSQLQVHQAHQKGNFGSGAHVAVIDTGCDGVSIDDFYDVLNLQNHHPGTPHAVDNVGHGTGMAKLIRGVAPDCKLTVIRTADQQKIPLWHLIAAVLLAVLDAQAEILNLSLGLSNITATCPKCGASPTARVIAAEYLFKALRRLAGKWLPGGQPPTFVAATGNDGSSSGFYLPARYDICLAVGAVNSNGQLSTFSTHGTPHMNYVVAPGGEIINKVVTESPISINNQKECGTSIAVAYTSGVLALFRTDSAQADLMTLATQKVRPASPKSVCGSGIIEYS